jgi:hypothetical protein
MASDMDVRLKKVEAGRLHGQEGWFVTLYVDRGFPEISFDFTSHVSDAYPEDLAVVVAKNYFQRTMVALGEHRADWQKSEGWLTGQKTEKKTE